MYRMTPHNWLNSLRCHGQASLICMSGPSWLYQSSAARHVGGNVLRSFPPRFGRQPLERVVTSSLHCPDPMVILGVAVVVSAASSGLRGSTRVGFDRPDDVSLGLVGAEHAGADRGGEMLTEPGVGSSDAIHCVAKTAAYRLAGAFDRVGRPAGSTGPAGAT